jgi:hypothetical protein
MAVSGVSMEALAAAMALLQSNPTMFASLAGGATVKPAKAPKVAKEEKKDRVVKEVADEDRCRAITWGTNGHPLQCSKAKKDNCRFCSLHQKKAEESEEPCVYSDTGRPVGLFNGFIADGEELDYSKVPFMTEDGKVCIAWKGPEELVARVKEARDGGAAFHPFCPEGGGKKNRPKDPDAPVRVRKQKGETTPKEPKEAKGRKTKDPNAPKRGKNAYFLFLDAVRAEVTEEVKTDTEWADKKHPQRLGEIARRVKARWDALSEEEKAPFLEAEAAEKARYAEEKAAYVPSTTVAAAPEAKKRGRPAGSSKKADAKADLATADAAVLSALLSAVKATTPKADDVEDTTEDAEEAGEDDADDAGSVPFDPEAEVAEEPEADDDEPYFTVEINGKDVMVMKADQGALKERCVYELTTDDDGDTVPGKQIGTWSGELSEKGKFVPLAAKKPTVVVSGKKA